MPGPAHKCKATVFFKQNYTLKLLITIKMAYLRIVGNLENLDSSGKRSFITLTVQIRLPLKYLQLI